MDLFTDDTVYEVFKRELRGREQVSAMLSQARKAFTWAGVRVELQAIVRRRFRTTCSRLTATSGNMGWYHRTLVRAGGTWKISHTKVTIGRKGALEPENLIRTARSLDRPAWISADCQSLAVSSGWAS